MMQNDILSYEATAKSRFLALLSYFGILCLVPMLINKDDEYVNFHARQGLMLWLWGVLAIFGLYLPVVGRLFFSVSALLIVVFSLLGIMSVLLTKAWRFPLIGIWADKL
ncbi:MAG: hypothetical protein IEMM0002_0318 [bacterium]|nr:MAG: hypothetical protein IEMM0002_0318 [bacterium]